MAGKEHICIKVEIKMHYNYHLKFRKDSVPKNRKMRHFLSFQPPYGESIKLKAKSGSGLFFLYFPNIQIFLA